MSSNQCTVCNHAERMRIELLLADGAQPAAVARKFSLAKASLCRHWNRHVRPELREALALGPSVQMELAARVCEDSTSALDHHRATRAGLYKVFNAAIAAGDGAIAAMVGPVITQITSAMASITGELAKSPLVQINQAIGLAADRDFQVFQARLIRTLAKFPDARSAVLAEFESLFRSQGAPALAAPAADHCGNNLCAVFSALSLENIGSDAVSDLPVQRGEHSVRGLGRLLPS